MRPPGRRGGGGRGPKVRGGGRGGRGGKSKGCLLLIVGSLLMLGSGVSLIALRMVAG
mgnify:FL=1